MSDLLQNGQPTVQPLVALTKPMPNTPAVVAYFYCSLPNASFVRADGKKLPFINGICKALFAEDIKYLNDEIASGNTYIRPANEMEVQAAETMEDPLKAMTKLVRPLLREELKEDLTLDELMDLVKKRQAGTSGIVVPELKDKEGQTTVNVPSTGGAAKPATFDPALVERTRLAIENAKKAKELLAQRQGAASGSLNTSNMNGADANSNSPK